MSARLTSPAGLVLPLMLAFGVAQSPPARAADDGADPGVVVVVGAAPLPGPGVDSDKLPGEVETLSAPDLLGDRRLDALPNALATQLSSLSVQNQVGSSFQPDFAYHGFEASPVSGVAQGVAVYQDGVRLNEAFGDNVNWDLAPEFAVRRITVQSDNPLFGLNAIGGAVELEMKDGLTYHGLGAELSGGSFGDVGGQAELGARSGPLGVYLGVRAQHEDGYRDASPATLRQAYGDLGYQSGPLELHLSLSGALNDIAATGPTPVQLLARDSRAAFTLPQATRNEMGLVQLHGVYRPAHELAVSINLFYRGFRQRLVDGNTTDVQACSNQPSQLCLEGQGLYPADALYDQAGAPVPANVLPAGATPAELDRTRTSTSAFGAAVQATLSAPVAGRSNSFTAGLSVDHGVTGYRAQGELGSFGDGLYVTGAGAIIDQSQSPTARPPIEGPVDLAARNTYAGAYAMDLLDLTRRLSLTLGARLNYAEIGLDDRLGAALTGRHSFSRINPAVGVSYRIGAGVTAYAGYSESSRAPTPGELSCADPASPCLLQAFLTADPKLRQVVSHDVEAGLRGRFQALRLPGTFSWNVAGFQVRSDGDILLLATPVNGFGYFQNAGTTRRRGVDLRLDYKDDGWRAGASYSYLDATFRTAETLSSNSPAADPSGLIQVEPGDRLPMSPAHRLTLSVDHDLNRRFSLGADLRLQSGAYLVGDDSNQAARLPAYASVNLRADLRLGRGLELYGEIENLLDRRNYVYGAFTSVDSAPAGLGLTDPRTLTPAPGRAVVFGLRARFG